MTEEREEDGQQEGQPARLATDRRAHAAAPLLPADTQVLDLTPSYADLVFDCIRVTWVAMIVSILFFEMNLGAALWTGLIAGFAYSVMVRLMYRQHFAAMQRLAEAQAAQRAGLQGGGQPQVQVVIAPAV